MSNIFSYIFNESLKKKKINNGSIVSGIVLSIEKDKVLIDASLKSESLIPIEQFYNLYDELEVKIGSEINFFLETLENGFGETILSRDKARVYECWMRLKEIYENSEIIKGLISNQVKGGFTVELGDGVQAFLPGSLVDVYPVQDADALENTLHDFKIIKLDKKINNVVVSRKAVIESKNINNRSQLLSKMQEGFITKGTVKNITDYGVFVDLGGLDGLLHITDLSWRRIQHPSELVRIGEIIDVKVIKFDKENSRVFLGLKQLNEDPWNSILQRYAKNAKVKGKVTNITNYGFFVEIEKGIEGLVHVSEIIVDKKNIKPSSIVSIGNIVEVTILNIDKKNRRISLSFKQCKINIIKYFLTKHAIGSIIKCKIKSISEFGIFVDLGYGIDGLIHKSSISCSIPVKKFIRSLKKNDKINASILTIDMQKLRISLGLKV